MEFKQLQSFEAVVRLGSFTKAAEALYLSQPTISAHIMALEGELNTQLILRTTKRVEPTAAGAEMYTHTVNLLNMRDRMIAQCRKGARSIIHLGASTIPSAYILPDLLASYGRLRPNVYFSIRQSGTQGVAEGLAAGLFDLGFTGWPISGPDYVNLPFCRDRAVLITPVSDRFLALKEEPAPPLEELLTGPIILREKDNGPKKNAADFLSAMGIHEEDLQVCARVNDQEAVKNLVASGMGVSILSELAARNFVEEKRILCFELPRAAKHRDLYLVHRRDHALKGYVLDFMEYVKGYDKKP